MPKPIARPWPAAGPGDARRLTLQALGGAAAVAALPLLTGCASTGPQPVAAPEARTGGRTETVPQFPSRHAAARRVTVWLPPGYDGRTPHAVLYMHDGQNLFDPAMAFGGVSWDVDLRLASLIAQRAVRPTIVVAIDNTPLRWREYVPAPALHDLAPDLRANVVADPAPAAREPLSDGYLRFIVEELKPWVDARYATRPGRDDTLVMGSSMGGLISLHALLSHPEVFGGAGCVSTHWPVSTHYDLVLRGDEATRRRLAAIGHRWLDDVARRLPAPGRHRLYFDHGTLGVDGLYAPFQQRMDALLQARGWQPGLHSHSQVFPGTDHNERAWSERVAIPLRFLLAPRAVA